MIRFGKLSILLFGLAAILIIAIVWFWRPGLWYSAENLGHRLGAGVVNRYPENTLEAFRESIEKLEGKDEYRYSECDLRETKDGEIVLFHDWDLARLVPDSEANRAALGVEVIGDQLLIKDLSLAQLQNLELEEGCRIPTLEAFLECAAELKPIKPILLELKLFHDRETCSRVIEVAKAFREQTGLEIHFLAFVRNLKRSHPNPRQWLDEFQAAGFRVYQVYRPKTEEHDLCETW